MRPELNEIQYIEFYLQGKLDKAQRLAFEKKMLSDAGFKQKVELQQQLERLKIWVVQIELYFLLLQVVVGD